MTGVVTNFAAQTGPLALSLLDSSFALCAPNADLVTLTAAVAALPSSSTPLAPVAAGAAGVAATLSRSDHKHPPQSATPNIQTGTTYTLQATDDGGVVELSNAGAITLTLPNSLPDSFSCLICQAGAGQVTISAASGTTIRQASGFSKTRTQWSEVALRVRTNVGGTSAVYVASGDMAA